MKEGSVSGAGSGSILLTTGSGSGSRRPKTRIRRIRIGIRIRNTLTTRLDLMSSEISNQHFEVLFCCMHALGTNILINGIFFSLYLRFSSKKLAPIFLQLRSCVGVSSSISCFLKRILNLLLQVTGALQTSTEVMRSMQSLVRLPEIQKTMQELSRSVILTSKFFLFNFGTL